MPFLLYIPYIDLKKSKLCLLFSVKFCEFCIPEFCEYFPFSVSQKTGDSALWWLYPRYILLGSMEKAYFLDKNVIKGVDVHVKIFQSTWQNINSLLLFSH